MSEPQNNNKKERRNLLNILLVDDDNFVQMIIKDLLYDMGILNVDSVSDGLQAVAAVADNHYELILCDLNMPEMDGIEFFRHLSEIDFNGGIAILSGSNIELLDFVANLVKGRKLELLGILTKPIDPQNLRKILDKVSSNRHPQLKPEAKLKHTEQLISAEELRKALEEDRAEAFFQPKINLLTGKVTGAESLARLRTPNNQILGPFQFITVAEDNGLIDELTLDIFSKTVSTLSDWLQGGHDLSVSVNLSEHNFHSLQLPEKLASIAQQHNVKSERITLEITESSVSTDILNSLDIMARMRLLGFNLSIDDFGTGYSSLEKLRQLPFNELKVDRQFVSGAVDNKYLRSILANSINLGLNLEMKVVAEGAELKEESELLAIMGCHEVQGFYYAKPMPANEFIDWLNMYSSEVEKAQ